MIGIEWYTQWGADPNDNSKAEPWHTDMGKDFGMNVAQSANLSYMVDRSSPAKAVIKHTSFKDALEDVEKWFDFSPTPCSIAIKHTYQKDNRNLSGTLDITFEDGVPAGEYKVMFLLVEDSLVYKQYDYGMSSDWGITVDMSLGYVPDYVHNHVVRDCIFGENKIWGKSLVSNPSAGQTVSVPFSYDVPTEYEFRGPGTFDYTTKYDPFTVRDEKVSLVAFVSVNDSVIVNTSMKGLLDSDVAITPFVEKGISSSDISMTVESQKLVIKGANIASIELFTANGTLLQVQDMQHTNSLSIKNLPTGVYFVRGMTGSGAKTKTLRFVK